MTLERLKQHLQLLEDLEKANDLLTTLEATAHPGAAKLTGMPRVSGTNDKVGDLAVEIADTKSYIQELKVEITKSEKPILAFIAGIRDPEARVLFRLRYIRGLPWKEVASIRGSFSTVRRVQSICSRYLSGNDDV